MRVTLCQTTNSNLDNAMYRRVAQRMDFPMDLQWGGAVTDDAFFCFILILGVKVLQRCWRKILNDKIIKSQYYFLEQSQLQWVC